MLYGVRSPGPGSDIVGDVASPHGDVCLDRESIRYRARGAHLRSQEWV
jgi:hypothetical protein